MAVADHFCAHIANAYVSGMKEEINVVGNEYQTFTTMWTMYVKAMPPD
jgi:ACS family pantothenate transporter-like MFS transporter